MYGDTFPALPCPVRVSLFQLFGWISSLADRATPDVFAGALGVAGSPEPSPASTSPCPEPRSLPLLFVITSPNTTAPVPAGDRSIIPARIPRFCEL
jgi:hypothetical protein